MNFSSIFKTISNYQFPYNLEEESIHETKLWTVYNGTRKVDSIPITAFKANSGSNAKLLFTNCIQKSKIMKIPGLCQTLEVLDSDPNNMFIITERVSPFNWDYLPKYQRNQKALQMGLSQLLNTFQFLQEFVIGTISQESIYINEKGQWVFFGLELLTNISNVNEAQFSNLVEQYYNSLSLPIHSKSYKTIDSINLYHFIKKLLGPHISKDWNTVMNSLGNGTLSIYKFFEKLQLTQSWLDNPLIMLEKDLREIHIKDQKGKFIVMSTFESIYFDSKLTFSNMTPGFIVGFVLPEIISVMKWIMANPTIISNANAKLVQFLAIVLELTNESKFYPPEFKQLIADTFKLPDRQVRFLLLIYLPKLIEPLGKDEISNRIYPQFLQGLSDSDSKLRLQSLKTVPVIVPCISERQLNNELLRYLAKTQVDPDVEVRTWTILIITRVASMLSASGNRASILGTAFTKSLKDPDIKPRLAALYGLEKSIDLLDVSTIATKILTVIAPGLLDKDALVRSKAKTLFTEYLNKLEKEAGNVQVSKSKEMIEDIDFDNYDIDDYQITEQFLSTLKLSSPSLENVRSLQMENEEEQQDDWATFEMNGEADGWDAENSLGESESLTATNVTASKNNQIGGTKVEIEQSWNSDMLAEQSVDTTGNNIGSFKQKVSPSSMKTKPRFRINTSSAPSRKLALKIDDTETTDEGWDDF